MTDFTEQEPQRGTPPPFVPFVPVGGMPQQPSPQQQFADEEAPPREQGGSKWDWIGSPSRPEAKEHDDGISDLFTVTSEDVGASDEDLSDLTDVDLDHDVIDADPDTGDLSDLVDVTDEDIMGFEGTGQRPSQTAARQRMARRPTRRYGPPPDTMAGGMRG